MKNSLKLVIVSVIIFQTTALAAQIKFKNEGSQKIATEFISSYADHVHSTYQNAISKLQNLGEAIEKLSNEPNQKNLTLAKEAWKESRIIYSQTEAFRFYGGPIDAAETGPEGLLNAWPLDESYIDYVKGAPKAGIINNPKSFPQITKELLMSLNEKDGEKNISTGYHAIEFLLWGQDFSTKSAGNRPVSDFDSSKNKVAKRRVQYLKLLNELAEQHLTQVAEQWDPKKGEYRKKFLKEPLSESLRKVVTGITTLSADEMAGERLTVALEINDQENEQDCFSDFSLADTHANQEGITNILKGKNFDKNLFDLIENESKKNARLIEDSLNETQKILNQVKDKSFDRIIANKSESSTGRKQIRALIEAFNKQSTAVAHAAKSMGLTVNIETEDLH